MLDGEPATPHAKVRFFAEKNRSEGALPNCRENAPCRARETPAHSSVRNLLAKRPLDNASEKPRKPPKSLQIGRLRRKNRIWRTVRAGPQYPGTSCLRGQGSRRHDVPRGKAPGAVRNARGSRGCPRRARLREVPGAARGAQDCPGRARRPGVRKTAGGAQDCRGCARLPGGREAAGARTYLECNAPPCPRISEFAPQPQPFPRPLLQV